jgi:hypothetical protein
MAPDLTQIALFVIGAFYVAGGYLATRAALMSRLIDMSIAAIAMEKPSAAATFKSAWLLTTAVLVLAAGAALLILSQLAVPLFVVAAASQALYVYVLAPRLVDKDDPPDETGRRRTRIALYLYLIATAFVMLSALGGSLFPPAGNSGVAWFAFLAIVGGHLAYVARSLWFPPSNKRSAAMSSTSDDYDDLAPIDPASIKSIVVMADYQIGPLLLDDGRKGTITTEMVQMSPELATALDTWARAYDMSFNHEDYSKPLWTDEQYAAHAEAGRRLAKRLARERPDLKVRFWANGQHHPLGDGAE